MGKFTAGQKVKLVRRNRCCAIGKVQFVGGRDGKYRSLGALTIVRGNRLIAIEKVTISSVRPEFSFKATTEDNKPAWDHTKTYLNNVFELHKALTGSALIAWPTNRVHLCHQPTMLCHRENKPRNPPQSNTGRRRSTRRHAILLA